MKLRILANSAGLCWVMRNPMFSGSFCKWCLLVLVVLIRLVMLSLLVGLFLLVSCHLFLLMMLASGVDAGLRKFSAGEAGSAADDGVCWFCWFWPALPLLLVVSGPAGGAGCDGFCW